jgi:2-keto-4-pentenoate hydratase
LNDQDRARRAAQYLLQLRATSARPAALPAELSARSEQEAYEVQREFVRACGLPTGGWKVAMSSPEQGTYAPILRPEIYLSPAQVACPTPQGLGIEPEVCFGLRHDLPALANGARYRREQLIEAIDAAYAAIEIVVSRFQSHDGAPPLDRLADNISNGGLVLGAPHRHWRAVDLGSVPLQLVLQAADGSCRQHTSRGGHPLGDPLVALLWLVNDRARAGAGLRAGELVTTGSYAGLHYAMPGARVSVEFAGLGTALLEVG